MKKFWYGVWAFTPLIVTIASVIMMIVSIILMVAAATGGIQISAAVPSVLLWISIVGLIVGIILCIVGAIIFSVHAKRNENLEGNAKGIWIVSFVTLVCFAFPAYFVKCIK